MTRTTMLVVGAALVWAGAAISERAPSATSARQAEIARLRAHFDSVDRELAARPLVNASPRRHAARAALRRWLHDYRNAGVFPRNTSQAHPTPIFRDRAGTLCAMAYLIARSGRADLVRAIASTQNYARIHELAGHPELVTWLDSVGLTIDEAARIQPQYGKDESVDGNYLLASMAADVLAVGGSVVMLAAPRRATGYWGVVTGGAATLLGVAQLDATNSNADIARWNVGIGAGTLALSAWTLWRGRSRGLVETAAAHDSGWRVTPLVVGRPAGMRLGVQLTRAF